MAVSQPNLKIQTILSGCIGLQLVDNTGVYNATTNPFGYGLPTGPAINDITQLNITLTYNSLGTTAAYIFTIASGTITAATLSLGGVTAVNIFANLTSTVWPFTTSNPFDLTSVNYGVVMPQFNDEAFQINYEIIGFIDPDDFDFTSISYLPVGCNLRCCINKKWQEMDPNCDCSSDKMYEANYLESLYNKFYWACDAGNLTEALTALREGQAKCGLKGGCRC